MGNVTVIPARRQIGSTDRKKEETPKLRVAAYCRVSTDSDEQALSYEAQIEHYTEYIQQNPDWVLAGIFAEIIILILIQRIEKLKSMPLRWNFPLAV